MQDVNSHAGSASALGVGGEVYKTNSFVAKNVLLKSCVWGRAQAYGFTLFGEFPAHFAHKQGKASSVGTGVTGRTQTAVLRVFCKHWRWWLGHMGWHSSDPSDPLHLMEVKKIKESGGLFFLSESPPGRCFQLGSACHPTTPAHRANCFIKLDLLKYVLGLSNQSSRTFLL